MSWFHVVSGALMAWSWLLLIFDRLGWRRKKGQLAETFQLSITSISTLWEMMEFRLVKEGFYPWGTHVLFWPNLDKLGLDGKGLQLFNCCWNLAGQLTWPSAVGIHVWDGPTQLGFVVELLRAWLSLQNEKFCHGWYSWAFINLVREVFLEGWIIIFPMSVGFSICKTSVKIIFAFCKYVPK